MKKLIIIGAGGFGREVIQWAKDINAIKKQWDILGYIDDNPNALEGCEKEFPILGKAGEWIPAEDEVYAAAIANPKIKEKLVCLLKSKGAVFTSIIHPNANIGDHNRIGEGVIIYPNASITVNCKIGKFVSVLGSNLGHDLNIGDYSTISGNCSLNGHVSIGNRVFIGTHCAVIPSRKIGDDAFICAGSIVISNVSPGSKVFGNPAKKINI